MVRVSLALNSAHTQQPESLSLMAVTRLMMQLRNMPYEYSSRWQTPAEVDLTQTADCKGKAVALYAQMRRNGAKNVRVVIGRRHMFDSGTHAWVEWQAKEGSFVLDPTFNDMPTRTAEFGSATYVPLYAYDGAHKYRAHAADSAAPPARVAAVTYVPAHSAPTLTRPALAGVGPKPTVSPMPIRLATTQHRQPSAQRTASAAPSASLSIGTRPSISPAPVRITTAQRTVSAAPPANVKGVSKTLAATSTAKSAASTHGKSAVPGKRLLAARGHVRHRSHVVSQAAKLRHARSPIISQNEMDPMWLPRGQ